MKGDDLKGMGMAVTGADTGSNTKLHGCTVKT